ncbi:MAG TPA: transcriptional repressor [Stellaceae bacterium]|nr:transcriptional repressor [Stellaceae bacterium]
MARKPVVSAAILELMHERHHHAWTLEDLQGALTGRLVAADFSSVFRAAEKLAAAGLVRKIVLDDGRARFELSDAHHDHLYCTACGELVPVPCLIARGDFAALERDAGIAIRDHHLVLSGLCRTCLSASQAQEGPA